VPLLFLATFFGAFFLSIHHFFPFFAGFFAVFAAALKAFAVGAPFAPGLRIFSPDPAAMRFRLAWMLAYNPGFFAIICLLQPIFLGALS
jgi:hypothetical protein